MEDACLDSDALIDAYDMGIDRFSGLHTTCISLYEFLRGLAYLEKQVREYKAYVESNLDVLTLDNKAIVKASELHAKLRKKGTLVEDPDLLIASMCVVNETPLVTGNVKHFERFVQYGLTVKPLNEFMESARAE